MAAAGAGSAKLGTVLRRRHFLLVGGRLRSVGDPRFCTLGAFFEELLKKAAAKAE